MVKWIGREDMTLWQACREIILIFIYQNFIWAAKGKTPRHIRGDDIKILQNKIPKELNSLNTFS
jgi:hypothetical protein